MRRRGPVIDPANTVATVAQRFSLQQDTTHICTSNHTIVQLPRVLYYLQSPISVEHCLEATVSC